MTDEPKHQLKINQVLHVPVAKVELHDSHWWVNFEGSWESLCFGTEKPYEVGDLVKITFEKVEP